MKDKNGGINNKVLKSIPAYKRETSPTVRKLHLLPTF